MLEMFLEPSAWIAIATLTLLEIVLGIDNIVFIAIVTERLPKGRQPLARRLGLGVALITRLLLLFALSWIIGLEKTLFKVPIMDLNMSGRSLIMLGGGLFLIFKSTQEIYHKTEISGEEAHAGTGTAAFGAVLLQIALMDMIFSLDSIITAVGMVDEIALMVVAIMIAVMVMIVFADPVSEFVSRNPSVKILALAFLLLIGVLLVAEGTGRPVEKGYIYFAMGFSLVVEVLNMRYRRNRGKRRLQEATASA